MLKSVQLQTAISDESFQESIPIVGSQVSVRFLLINVSLISFFGAIAEYPGLAITCVGVL